MEKSPIRRYRKKNKVVYLDKEKYNTVPRGEKGILKQAHQDSGSEATCYGINTDLDGDNILLIHVIQYKNQLKNDHHSPVRGLTSAVATSIWSPLLMY